ncbi:S-type pyocin domain-containing protein [Pseudomonas sp. KB_12]|uniref:S-type pyocin domain-containing protein n=1 Tax=Pseudomonas sp. KB_12 TaxID=3233034 RepID=UPI003F97A96C
MQQEKNILVNRGIPRTPPSSSPSPNHGHGGTPDRSAGRAHIGTDGDSSASPSFSDYSHAGFEPAIGMVLHTLKSTTKTAESTYQTQLSKLPQTIENDLAAIRLEGSTRSLPPAAAIARELSVRNTLLARKTAQFHQKTALANSFYGVDPIGKPLQAFYPKALTLERLVPPNGIAIKAWATSLKAAYEARLLSQAINMLNQQQVEVLKWLAAVQAQEQVQKEVQRLAAEKAQKVAQALREAEERAKIAAVAATKARQLAEAEKAREKAFAARTFPVSAPTVATAPAFSFSKGELAISPTTALTINTMLRTAIPAVIEAISAVATPVIGGFAALLYPSQLGNGDLYALSVPLSELLSDNSDDLYAIAATQGEIKLPVVIGSRTTVNKREFVVAGSTGPSVPSKVPVRLATLDPHGDFYWSRSPDTESIGMTWTPITRPGNASTYLPANAPNLAAYSGATPVAVDGRIDTHPELDNYSFGGFITVFPIESGIQPFYTVFSSPYEGATTKGEHSGRDFNPEQAGGPILELDWRSATVTQEGIDAVKLHIARLDQSDANDVMIERLERILKEEIAITDVDKRFYTHETRELERFRAQGLTDDFIPSNGSAEWNNAHTATLEDYKLGSSESLLYSLEALEAAEKQTKEIYKRLLKGEF